jgi:hypothetical protein
MKWINVKRGQHYLPKRLRIRIKIISEDIDCPIRILKYGWSMEQMPDINVMYREVAKSFMIPESLL